MKKILYFTLLNFFALWLCFAEDNSDRLINESLGKLLLLHDFKYSYQKDLNPFGGAEIYDEFVRQYDKKISKLPKKIQVDYLWSVMWHMDFDGHYMYQFQQLVMKDCGPEFIARLEGYIEKESKLNRNKTKFYLSKQVLAGLNLIKSN